MRSVRPAEKAPAKASIASGARLLRLALVSDTHGFVDPRIAEFAGDCDAVVHAGDIGNRSVLDLLRPRRRRVFAVRGNNDTPQRWPRGERAFLRGVPRHVEISLPGGTLIVVHGDRALPASTRHERLRRTYPDARAVVYGHTHRAVCDRTARPWILNPGAAGRARTFGGPSCIVLEAGTDAWRIRLLRVTAPRG